MIRAAVLAADSFYCLDEMKSDPIKALCNLDISWVETSYEEVKPPVVCFFSFLQPIFTLVGPVRDSAEMQRCTLIRIDTCSCRFSCKSQNIFWFKKKKKVKAVSCTLCRLLIILHNSYSQSKQ